MEQPPTGNVYPFLLNSLNRVGFTGGFGDWTMHADPIPIGGGFTADSPYRVSGTGADAATTPYGLNVQGVSDTGMPGVQYSVGVYVITGDNNTYRFESQTSPTVFPASAPYNAPPVTLDFIECAGWIHVMYRDALNPTQPVAVNSSGVYAKIQPADTLQHLEINANDLVETVSQVVSNLSTNCPVTFCFNYRGRFGLVDSTPNNDFTVTLSGGSALSVPLNPVAGGWFTFCTNFVPTASAVTIAYRGAPHSTTNGPGGAHIDTFH